MDNNEQGNKDVRSKIIKEAVILFAEKGYERTSINDICEAVGISKGGLNYYFKEKEAILMSVHEEFIDYELLQAQSIIEKKLRPDECLKELIESLVESIYKYFPYCVTFFQSKSSLSKDNMDSISVKRKLYSDIFLSCLNDGVEAGIFTSEFDVEIIHKIIFGTCNWTLYWLDTDGRLTDKELARIFYSIIINGIKA